MPMVMIIQTHFIQAMEYACCGLQYGIYSAHVDVASRRQVRLFRIPHDSVIDCCQVFV